MKREHTLNRAAAAPAHRLRLLAGMAATLLLLSGCGRDSDDLQAYMAQVKSRPAAPIEPIPEMRSFASAYYIADSGRDPFAAPRPVVEQRPRHDGPRPDASRPREVLEDYPLDSLRMMGTLEQAGTLWALVRDPGGTVHRVRVGNYVGQNHGEIVAISENAIRLNELVGDGDAGWIRREAALALRD